MERPQWPYVVLMFGGALFGLAALGALMLAFSDEPSDTTAKFSLLGLAIGGAAISVAWLGAFKHGHGGFGAIAGSAIVPLAMMYAYSHRGDFGEFRAVTIMVAFSLAALALGHVFARGLRIARIVAGFASFGLVISSVAAAADHRLGRGTDQILGAIGLGGLAVLGFALVGAAPGLRSSAADEPQL